MIDIWEYYGTFKGRNNALFDREKLLNTYEKFLFDWWEIKEMDRNPTTDDLIKYLLKQ